MERRFPHQIICHPTRLLTPTEIAESLIAHERLIRRSVRLLQSLCPGLEVTSVSIRLNSVKTSSLQEDFLVSVFATFQDDLRVEVTDIVQAFTGVDIPEKYDGLVTLGVLLIALFAGKVIISRLHSKPPERAAPYIQGDYNTVLNITAETINIDPKTVDQSVSRLVNPFEIRQLGRSISSFFQPAKKGENSEIEVSRAPNISKRAVAEITFDMDYLDDSIKMEPITDTLVDVRALDRDRAERGWAARLTEVDGIYGSLPMRLYPDILPDAVAEHSEFRAAVAVELRRDRYGEFVP